MKNFWKNKKVLVTGGAGFIGSHMTEALVGNGAVVTVVVSPNTSEARIKKNLKDVLHTITIRKADLLSFEDTLQVLKGQDVVLNFAAMDGGKAFKMKHAAEIFRTNTQVGLNILESSLRNNVERVLLISSIEVYPEGTSPPIKEEDLILSPQATEDGYVWSKRFLEIAAKMYSHEYEMKIAIARLGNIYGPRDYATEEKARVIPVFIGKSLQGEDLIIWGSGETKRSFLHVRDLVQALLDLTENYPTCDPVNIASNNVISISQLAGMVVDACNKKNKVVIDTNKHSISQNKIVDITKAKKVISFNEKVPLVEGLQETARYYKEQYNEKGD